MKKIKTRKEIIKDIAIVFLVIMLLLTFFSNTIMNLSLVQVNGKYTEYGNLRTGVRGSGTVQATSVFEQAVKGQQRVVEVYVRQGDRVEAGQPIMKLESAGSEEVTALENQLKTLKESYDKALISREPEADYTLTLMNIEDKKAELSELKEERAFFTEEKIAQIIKAYDEAEKGIEALQDKIEALEETITEISEKSDDEVIKSARLKRDNAKSAFEYAEECLEKAREELSEIGGQTNLDSLNSQYNALGRTLASLLEEKGELEEEYAPLFKLETDLQSAKTELDRILADTSATPEQIAEAQGVYDAALLSHDAKKTDIKAAHDAVRAVENQIEDVSYDQSVIYNQIRQAKSDNKEYDRRKAAVDVAEGSYNTTKKALDTAEEALKNAVESVSKETTDALKSAKKDLKSAEEGLEELGEDKEKAEGTDEMDKEIRALEKELFEMEYNFEKQKGADERAEALENYDLKLQKEEIEKLTAELVKLRGDAEGEEFEFLSKYTGVISEFNCRVGETLPDGTSVISVESEESGFTLSFSVKNEDARKVAVGDTASVTGGWWGSSVSATLREIKNETGGKTKLLVFDIMGDVSAGQMLTLLVGEKTTSYPAVVPKSAVREDKDGKYVYITKTKSTPLGNRYEVVRLAIDVVASDDVNSAITTSDNSYLYEYVITSTTGPVAEGDYVRLAD